MIIRRNREYRVNMGRFEHVLFGMDVTINNDTDFPGLTAEELSAKSDELIADGLSEDIINAGLDTDEALSFIRLHPLNQPAPKRKQ